MFNHEDISKNSLYLGHFFGGTTFFSGLAYLGLRFTLGKLSSQTNPYIYLSLFGSLSASLVAYAYHFGYQKAYQTQDQEIIRLMNEIHKKNSIIEDCRRKLDNLEILDNENFHPNSPTSVHSDTESYEILTKEYDSHFKAN